MMTLNKNSIADLQTMARAVRTDPVSWCQWGVAYISVNAPDACTEEIMAEAAAVIDPYVDHHSSGGWILKNGDIILAIQNLSMADLRKMACDVVNLMHLRLRANASFRIYNLEHEWRQFAFLCDSKRDVLERHDSAENTADYEKIEAAAQIFSIFDAVKDRKLPHELKKVMIVDDDRLTRHIVAKVLQDEVELVTAEDVSEALIHYVTHAPDVVFLDIGLPDINGKALLHTLLEHDPNANIVMFSGNDDLDNRLETLVAGAVGFVRKPFRKKELMHYIERAG